MEATVWTVNVRQEKELYEREVSDPLTGFFTLFDDDFDHLLQ